jgi:RimK family alpha-L-glutamate ligase
MRLLLLTARPELETNRRLQAAARAQGVEVVTVDAARVSAAITPKPALRIGSDDLLDTPIDGVLARVGNWRPDSVLAALEVALEAGAATPNPPRAIRIGRDHWRTVHTLAAAGLAVPATVAGGDPEELAAAAAALSFPVVVKQRRSRMGVGVIRCASRDHLESVLDSLWRLGDEIVVQEFVPTDGRSLRLLVVGDRTVAAGLFSSPSGDWRSNAARGGSAEPYRPSDAEQELARSAARAVGLGVCGVDLLPGATTAVGEVNPTPGFLRLEEASGVDVAAEIVRHVARCASRSRSDPRG